MTVRCGEEAAAPVRSRKALSLLALLALRANREQSRDWLAATVWPDSAAPRETLRRTLTDLRSALGPCAPALVARSQTLCLRLPERQVDALWFHALRKRDDLAAWDEAIALYRGSLLEGFRELWCDTERVPYAEAYVGLLERASAVHEERNNLATATAYLRAAVKAAPFRESLHRDLMQILVKSGAAPEAIRVYRDLRQFLQETTRAEPATETVALYRQIRTSAPAISETQSDRKSASASAGYLPHPLTRLIGREAELAQVRERLSQSRLVTIAGMGGMGKTRLAIEAATDLRDAFSEGVWFVDLAALSDPARLSRTLAQTLNLPEEAGQDSLSTLLQGLRSRHLLLILDNCEHLLSACASLVSSLVQQCPRLSILATSRQALRIRGEYLLGLTPLPTPETPATTDTGELSPAVQLFLERATAIRSDFAPTPLILRAARTICQRLEGIPLAIELAAAHIRSLSVEQIAERLEDRFRLLQGRNRMAPERQQSLRGLLDWSYDLLESEEQTLFIRLSVFAGGWTLEAAAAVCGEAEMTEDSPDTWETLDLLDSLVEKSLVLTVDSPDGETRYRMLETLREYGGDRLEVQGETARLQQRHREWFLRFAESAEKLMGSPGQTTAMQQIVRDQDNLRLALKEMASETDRLRLAVALFWHWYVHGHYAEGREALEKSLQSPSDFPVLLRCKALKALGDLCWAQGDMEAARTIHRENLELQQREQDERGLAVTWNSLALIEFHQGNCAGAAEYYRKSLAIFRTRNEPPLIGSILSNLAMVLKDQGDEAGAMSLLTEAEAIFRQTNNNHRLGIVLHTLAHLAKRQGDYVQALKFIEEARQLDQEVNDVKGQAVALHTSGEIALEQGDLALAEQHFQAALEQFDTLGAPRYSAAAHFSLGEVARAHGDWNRMKLHLQESLRIQLGLKDQLSIAYILCSVAFQRQSIGETEEAARLLAAAHAELERLGAILNPHHFQEYERTRLALQESLGTERFEHLWQEGSAFDLEQAITYAGIA